MATLQTLRQIAHALRGHPTPLGAGINSLEAKFAEDGTVSDDKAAFQLAMVGDEVVALADATCSARRWADPPSDAHLDARPVSAPSGGARCVSDAPSGTFLTTRQKRWRA